MAIHVIRYNTSIKILLLGGKKAVGEIIIVMQDLRTLGCLGQKGAASGRDNSKVKRQGDALTKVGRRDKWSDLIYLCLFGVLLGLVPVTSSAILAQEMDDCMKQVKAVFRKIFWPKPPRG